MDSIRERYRRRRARRQRRRGSSAVDCLECADCGDCSPLLLSTSLLVLVLRVVPGAFHADAVDPWAPAPRGALARAASRLVRSYQLHVSVPRARPVCSMSPSCSRYALQALSRHGAWRGGLLVARRLRRCGRPGAAYDPVPVARQP